MQRKTPLEQYIKGMRFVFTNANLKGERVRHWKLILPSSGCQTCSMGLRCRGQFILLFSQTINIYDEHQHRRSSSTFDQIHKHLMIQKVPHSFSLGSLKPFNFLATSFTLMIPTMSILQKLDLLQTHTINLNHFCKLYIL